MTRWLRKQKRNIIIFILSFFLLATFMGGGAYLFTRSPYDAAIVVNGEKIPYDAYERRIRFINRMAQMQGSEIGSQEIEQRAAQNLIQEAVLLKEAVKYGITVSDEELSGYIQSLPPLQRDGQFDPQIYKETVKDQFGLTPQQFESDRRRELIISHLYSILSNAVQVSPLEIQWARVRAATSEDKEVRELAKADPAAIQQAWQRREAHNALQNWLAQLNEKMEVKMLLDKWRTTEPPPTDES